MKMHAAVLSTLCLIVLSHTGRSQENAKNVGQRDVQLVSLQKQKVNVLTNLVRATETLVQGIDTASIAEFELLIQAHSDLTEAKLDLATNRNDKVEILQADVEFRENFVRILKARGEAGVPILRGEADLIEAKIRLVKCKQ